MVVTYGLGLTGAGLIVGLAGAIGVNRLLTSLLFEIEPTDPTTLAAVLTAIAVVAVVASVVPAWRASTFDPNVVLRVE